MADLTIYEIDPDGTAVTFASAGGSGDKIDNSGPNRGRVYAHVRNDSGSSITVTVTAQRSEVKNGQYGDLAISDKTITVGASAEKVIGPFAPYIFNDSNGDVNLSYSATTSVTVAAVKYKALGE